MASVVVRNLNDADRRQAILFELLLRMGDNCLILGQQIGKWCGHAPELEEDIALANVGLDMIGQTQMWLGYAGEVEGAGRSADDLAFLRDAAEFRNVLLAEQDNGHYGQTIMRQFLFDTWHLPMLEGLCRSSDNRIAEIAAKSVKEAAYHFDRSADLIIRLGDGTDQSHDMMQDALNDLYFLSGELYIADENDKGAIKAGLIPPLDEVAEKYQRALADVTKEARLIIPADTNMRLGGKAGMHSERLSYILAEMQQLQRNLPGMKW